MRLTRLIDRLPCQALVDHRLPDGFQRQRAEVGSAGPAVEGLQPADDRLVVGDFAGLACRLGRDSSPWRAA